MTLDDAFALPSTAAPAVVGTGLIALDIVIGSEARIPVGAWAGGTCGNVLTALAYLGWKAYPLARLTHESTSRLIAEDMKRWGVHLDFLRTETQGSTPVIIHQIRRSPSGEAIHSFSCRCPLCGSHLPGYRPVPVSIINQLLPLMPAPVVFFFDRSSRGSLQLAQDYAAKGALVVYEPSGVGDLALFNEAIRLAHVVEYSHDRMGDVAALQTAQEPLLLIETLGRNGLRYRSRLPAHRRKKWTNVEAFRVSNVLDAAGAGDWCTAGLIHYLGKGGLQGFLHTNSEYFLSAMRFAQALAAWNCTFEGARGGMYRATPAQFRSAVRSILLGEEPSSLGDDRPRRADVSPQGFTCSSCQQSPA
jgi:sugar/nucleoside kinase (ribokinase family)